MFLHYLLTQNEEEMLSKFFEAQWENPSKNDWTETVKNDLRTLQINLSTREIKAMKKERFKGIVKQSVKAISLKYLLSMKQKQSKMDSLEYSELKTQSYLKSDKINAETAKSAFRYRVRMARVKRNYPRSHSDLNCPLLCGSEDRQEHLCGRAVGSVHEGPYS